MPVKKVQSSRQRRGSPEATKLKVKSEKKVTKPVTAKTSGLSVPVYSLTGRAAGTMILPKEIFGQEVNKKLLSQAMRVYLTNRTGHYGSTKKRGEVRGSTAKIYRQKGMGRARHGAITAPIFVGGGIAFGPKPRKTILNLPKKIRRAALISALSSKMTDKNISGISGLEKATGKTKEVANFLEKMAGKEKKIKSALIVTEDKKDNLVRAVRNIENVAILPANLINAYEILKHDKLIITKEAVGILRK
ncbi:MAG: 50S ribosomal protein L4 [Candidatus Daviesbacteria bacterium]|nr:50S ribosomal protein L4 [Candidatus Daviesbacteria bacterium]